MLPAREFRPCEPPWKGGPRAHVPGPVSHLDSLPEEGAVVPGSSPLTASTAHLVHSPRLGLPHPGSPTEGAQGGSTTRGDPAPARQTSRAGEGASRLPTGFGYTFSMPVSTQAPPTHDAGQTTGMSPLTSTVDAPPGRVCAPQFCGLTRPTNTPQLTVPHSVLGDCSPATPSSREEAGSARALFDWRDTGLRRSAPPEVVPGSLRPRDRVWSCYFGPPSGTPQSSPRRRREGVPEKRRRGGE